MSMLTPYERDRLVIAGQYVAAGLEAYPDLPPERNLVLTLDEMVRLVHKLDATPFDGPDAEFHDAA